MPLFCLTIFLGAFLLFQVQLIIAKCLLPWFGGTPAVWTTCMLFFQVLLVGGYAYAHKLCAGIKPKPQGRLHIALLGTTVCLLLGQWVAWETPMLLNADWKPADGSLPTLKILLLLTVSIGLPYFALSATSPLVQAWFSRTAPARSPYWLYALSNAGSLLGLLTYPFLIAPNMALRTQAWAWSAGYTAFACCCAGCGVLAMRAQHAATQTATDAPADTTDERQDAPTPWPTRLAWLGFPAIASILLLATTNKITEEVAVFPFLWVMTLAVYLLTFILCFGHARLYQRWLFLPLAGLSWGAIFLLMIINMPWGAGVDAWGIRPLDAVIDWIQALYPIGIVWQTIAYVFAMFASCMVCHGEVYRLRPAAARLTNYYLYTSIGGALGGVFVAVAAPLLFSGLWELDLGYILLAGGLLALSLRPQQQPAANPQRLGVATAGLACAAALVAFVWPHCLSEHDVAPMRRNFYGVLRVKQGQTEQPHSTYHALWYAGTMHGYQYQYPRLRRKVTAYYTPATGVSHAINHHPRRADHPLEIGVVGLGTGTLAALGRDGDRMAFYEINPAVIDLATEHFTYLRDSRAAIDPVITGDARISLERTAAQGESRPYDVLVIDAFSGDAIPVHLLTLEAFHVYLDHLKPDGILAIHVTNRYFELPPVVWRLSEELGLACTAYKTTKNRKTDTYNTHWMLLSRSPDTLAAMQRIASEAPATQHGPTLQHTPLPGPLWTDNYANLFRVIDHSAFQLVNDDT